MMVGKGYYLQMAAADLCSRGEVQLKLRQLQGWLLTLLTEFAPGSELPLDAPTRTRDGRVY